VSLGLSPTKAEKGFWPNCSWAALSIGSCMSVYSR